MPEAFVFHVVLHLSEDGLWLYASFPPIFYSFFRSKSFRGLLSVFGKTVVDLDDPVALDLGLKLHSCGVEAMFLRGRSYVPNVVTL